MSIYKKCIDLAKQSPCQKRGFGCVGWIPFEGFVAETYNKPLDATKHICEPECIRMSIRSGSDSMIGACVHAEEHAIWKAIHNGHDPADLELYVAGVTKPENEHLIKSDPHFYCIRCATLMLLFEVRGVYVYVNGKWEFLTSEEAYETSKQFALKQVLLDRDKA